MINFARHTKKIVYVFTKVWLDIFSQKRKSHLVKYFLFCIILFQSPFFPACLSQFIFSPKVCDNKNLLWLKLLFFLRIHEKKGITLLKLMGNIQKEEI